MLGGVLMIPYQCQSTMEVHIEQTVAQEELFQRLCIQLPFGSLLIHNRYFSQHLLFVLLLPGKIMENEKKLVSA